MSLVPYEMYAERIRNVSSIRQFGRVIKVVGLVIESAGPAVSIGRLCTIENRDGKGGVKAEVVGFRENRILLMPLGSISGITPGAMVTTTSEQLRVPVGDELIGRVMGGLGQPIDDKGPITAKRTRPVMAPPISPLKRTMITDPIRTGIRAIDMTSAVGVGQRMGIFAGSGVGKSILLGMIARGSTADVNVIALIGERGREVKEFIENDLGSEGMKKSIVIAVTSDQPALIRVKGAMVATAIAEHFRDQGKNVMLLMDSVTRVATAQREIGIAAGEPPTTRGYTPSVFAMLPTLLERAGQTESGSITGLYTVLVEGDDLNEPISDAVRSILDGHVSLSRKLAARNQYPAVDFLDSISRLMPVVATEEECRLAAEVRSIVSTYREAEDLINVGAYVAGSSPAIDRAIEKIEELNAFFRQDIHEMADHADSVSKLKSILEDN